MAFDSVDVLDELALYPDRRQSGMSRAEILEAMGFDESHAESLKKILGHLRRSGFVRREGSKRYARWFITLAGMEYPDPLGWDAEPPEWDFDEVVESVA